MVELRDYQTDLLRQVDAALDGNSNARVMMQLPTGGGKTIIASGLLKVHLSGGRKAVWLTHRRELAEQTREMLTSANVSAIADVLWKPKTDAPAMSGGVVILMAQTVSRRIWRRIWNQYDEDDLMVIDEAHHATAKGYAEAMKQWPGRVVGMTATPWRLSEKEGFDHLFEELVSGPQVADLQSEDWLCRAEVRVPSNEGRIQGGEVGSIGDYTEPGIEQANSRDLMTAGTLRFWKEHAKDRQTIVYAVSTDHAHNLASVFVDAGIPARVILGDTPVDERNKTIEEFRDGDLRVLVNVLVATEGFDLPDASCVVLTRPTLSLALFMQMVGRGLRPKDDGGDCMILDLAANSIAHGLPEDGREWQLEPRGKQEPGDAPVVWCPRCETVSPAASHICPNCGEPFGKECTRCGKWRAWKRWQRENHCDNAHELVCDYCHRDAHIQARIPIVPPLDGLPYIDPEGKMYPQTKLEIDDKLADALAPVLRELLEQERQSILNAGAVRQDKLFRSVQTHERVLNDDNDLYVMFTKYLQDLPAEQRPQNIPQRSRMFTDWERDLKDKLGEWRHEIAELKSQPIDKQLVFENTKNKLMQLLSREAQDVDLLPNDNENSTTIDREWLVISPVTQGQLLTGREPISLRLPDGREIQINIWQDVLVQVAEWLINDNRLSRKQILTKTKKNYIISDTQVHSSGKRFRSSKKLSNGLYLETGLSVNNVWGRLNWIIKVTGTLAQFHVRLS